MIPLGEAQHAALAAIADREAGLHMPAGKRAFVAARLQRRLRRHGIADFDVYLRLVTAPGPEGIVERRHLVSALTTNVTHLYREPHHFGFLAAHLREWARDRTASDARYGVWSAGCASGEEPLSMAATCRAVLGAGWTDRVRILATDVDQAALDVALERPLDRAFEERLRDLPREVRTERLAASAGGAGIVADLQRDITYLRHNLRDPLPLPGRFDVIFCRNVTIYFSPEAQRDVHRRLRARLAPDGMLAIGHSERLSPGIVDLAPIGRTIFRERADASPHSDGMTGCP